MEEIYFEFANQSSDSDFGMAEFGFFKEIFHHETVEAVFEGIYVIFADQSFDFAVFKPLLDQTIEVSNF